MQSKNQNSNNSRETKDTKERKAKEASDANREKQIKANRDAAEANRLLGINPLNGNTPEQQIASDANRKNQQDAAAGKKKRDATESKVPPLKKDELFDSETGTVFFSSYDSYDISYARAVHAGQVAQDAINVAAAELDNDDKNNIEKYYAMEANEAINEAAALDEFLADAEDAEDAAAADAEDAAAADAEDAAAADAQYHLQRLVNDTAQRQFDAEVKAEALQRLVNETAQRQFDAEVKAATNHCGHHHGRGRGGSHRGHDGHDQEGPHYGHGGPNHGHGGRGGPNHGHGGRGGPNHGHGGRGGPHQGNGGGRGGRGGRGYFTG